MGVQVLPHKMGVGGAERRLMGGGGGGEVHKMLQ